MPDDRLERVASAVADGTPVDWALEEGLASGDERPLLRELRVIAEIGTAAQGPGAGDRWGPLRLVSLIGSGAFGDVFRARDERLRRDVALKLVREPGVASAVVAEGRILAQVRHRGVVTVHGADRIEGRAGIWMELIEGRTLEDILNEQGPWDAKAAALAGAELCAALAAVHATGLVHRDVKAQNVMREAGGRIVLMDFGVGHALDRNQQRRAGTPLYMAPEVLAGGSATLRSDLYSLGVLLYHLVTGAYPVKGTTVEELRQAHAACARVSLRDARPDLPDAFVPAVERALQAEPERRFATAGEMEQALLETLRPEEKPSAQHTSRIARLLAGLGVAALGGLLFFVFLPRREGSRPEPVASSEAPTPTVFRTPSPSPTPRDGRPSADPFVAPLGTPSSEPQTPTVETAYAIDARLEGADLLVRASAAVSLYVFAIDDADQPLLVFPIPGRRPENPLVPGQETRLWIGAAPSRSRLVAVASPARLVGLEAEMARQRVPLASWWGALPLTQPALAHLGSALGFAPRDAGRFLAGAPPLTGHVEMLRGVWTRRLGR